MLKIRRCAITGSSGVYGHIVPYHRCMFTQKEVIRFYKIVHYAHISKHNVETKSEFYVETTSDFNVETTSDFNVETTSYFMLTNNVVKVSYSFNHVQNRSRSLKSQIQRL